MKRLLASVFLALLALEPGGNATIASDAQEASSGFVASLHSPCSLPIEEAVIDALCPPPAREVESSAYHFLKDQLRRGDLHQQLVCSIEATIISAAEVCNAEYARSTRNLIADLMQSTAEAWWELGRLNKADTAFRRTIELRATTEDDHWLAQSLRGWAHLKIELGDSLAAKELIDQHVSIAHQVFDKDPTSTVRKNSLVRALRSQSYIYEIIGLSREAAELIEKAEALEAAFQEGDGD